MTCEECKLLNYLDCPIRTEGKITCNMVRSIAGFVKVAKTKEFRRGEIPIRKERYREGDCADCKLIDYHPCEKKKTAYRIRKEKGVTDCPFVGCIEKIHDSLKTRKNHMGGEYLPQRSPTYTNSYKFNG